MLIDGIDVRMKLYPPTEIGKKGAIAQAQYFGVEGWEEFVNWKDDPTIAPETKRAIGRIAMPYSGTEGPCDIPVNISGRHLIDLVAQGI